MTWKHVAALIGAMVALKGIGFALPWDAAVAGANAANDTATAVLGTKLTAIDERLGRLENCIFYGACKK